MCLRGGGDLRDGRLAVARLHLKLVCLNSSSIDTDINHEDQGLKLHYEKNQPQSTGQKAAVR